MSSLDLQPGLGAST